MSEMLNDLQQPVIDVLFEAGAWNMHASLSRESIRNALDAVPGLGPLPPNAPGPCLAGLKRRGLVQKHLNECWSLTDEGVLMERSDEDEEENAPTTCSPGYVGNPDNESFAPIAGVGRIEQLTRGLSTSLNQLRNQHDDELQAELLAVIDGLGELAAQEYRRTADPHIGELPAICADLRRRVERARICSDGAAGEVAA